jgi:predicted dehydrogenase/threonine dehydrogenase-like Zn-dependent dehydrogenase
MKQLTQQLKSGKMEILEVPFPALNKGYIMVRNHFSVISAGTEGKTVTDARMGYIAKAKSRRKEVLQVLDMVKTDGILPTYKLVMNKLEAPAALGYSAAGEVIAVGKDVLYFKVGDYVACGGGGAFHADVVSVPVNLAVKVPKIVDLKQAAFTTIASIAIQGIRQADIRMGENCLIIGMGIIGQITYKILEASGTNPIGIDISEDQVMQSKGAGIKNIYNRNQDGIEEIIMNFTKGYGCDSIIITAGTSSLDPVEFAGAMARKKAKVVIVGAVPTGFSRMHYYKKELDLRMSSSYGPGRSDMSYEENGQDYPIGYVRWTENRNMQSYIDLLSTNRLNIEPLISHTFSLEDAPKAYDLILARKEPFAGVVIQYDDKKTLNEDITLKQLSIDPSDANVGLIGAGNFAQNMLLPRMKGFCNFVSIATMQGNESVYVGKKYGFINTYSDAEKVISNKEVNTLFIVTRHNTHAEFVMKGINAKKHVFVEKPLAMNEQELSKIKADYKKVKSNGNPKYVMVGFNRRFAPSVLDLKKLFVAEQTKSIVIRVNSGIMPVDHWVNDPEIGGGRIIGEACHFIDLAMFLADSPIISISADAMSDPNTLNNTVIVSLKMENGSVATINYFANGNNNVPKEYIEVFSGGTIAQIDDFKMMKVYGKKIRKIKYKGQDKGHANCVQAFLKSIKEGLPCPIPFSESHLSMLATFKVLESIAVNRKIIL